jgi:hypothetical protein
MKLNSQLIFLEREIVALDFIRKRLIGVNLRGKA